MMYSHAEGTGIIITIEKHKNTKNKVVHYKKRYIPKEGLNIQQRWLISVLNRKKINMTELANALDITKQAVSAWMCNVCKIPMSKLKLMKLTLNLPDDVYKVYDLINSH